MTRPTYQHPTLICTGINAPARLLAAMSFFFQRVDHAPPMIFGLGLDYVLFLIGVVALWFLVGSVLGKRRSSPEPRPVWSGAKLLLVGVPLSLMGALFLYASVSGFMTRWNFNRLHSSPRRDHRTDRLLLVDPIEKSTSVCPVNRKEHDVGNTPTAREKISLPQGRALAT